MPSLNKVILIGNLTRDPELRSLQGGKSVCNFGIAINERWKDAQGNWKDKTTFVDVTAWGKTADVVGNYLEKGSLVAIDGRLDLEQWESDGQKRSKLKVVVDTLQMLDRKEQRPTDDKPAQSKRNQRQESAPDDDIPF